MANSYGITPEFATLLLSALGGGRPRVPIVCGQLHDGNPGPQGVNNPSAVTSRQELIVSAPNAGAVALTGVPPSWEITDEETIAAISLWSGFDGDPNAMCLFTLAAMPPVTVAEGDTLVLGACDLEWAPAAAGLWAPGKTVAVATAQALAGMLVPRVTAGGVVAVPSMSAVAGMNVPVVRTYRNPAPVMHASAGMLTPTVTAAAKVTAPAATGTAAALAPTAAAGAAVQAPVMTATAGALAPTATTRTLVSVPAMAATAGMLAPTVKTTLPIAFDAVGSGAGGTSSFSFSITAAKGADIFVDVCWDRSGAGVTGVTYGGKAMTLIGGPVYHDNNASYGATARYRLAGGGTGSAATVAVSCSGIAWYYGNAVSVKGVTSVGSAITSYGASSSISQAFPGNAGQFCLWSITNGNGGSSGATVSSLTGGTLYVNAAQTGAFLAIAGASGASTLAATMSAGVNYACIGHTLS